MVRCRHVMGNVLICGEGAMCVAAYMVLLGDLSRALWRSQLRYLVCTLEGVVGRVRRAPYSALSATKFVRSTAPFPVGTMSPAIVFR